MHETFGESISGLSQNAFFLGGGGGWVGTPNLAEGWGRGVRRLDRALGEQSVQSTSSLPQV